MRLHNEPITNFEYLQRITSSDQELMREVIKMYLSETPKYLEAAVTSLNNQDWDGLYQAVHKIIPSFQIVGIGPEHVVIALDIQKTCKIESERFRLPALVNELQILIHIILEELSLSLASATIGN
jgi:HPt (histidine-containing phosphotransfer) domain-containing protein